GRLRHAQLRDTFNAKLVNGAGYPFHVAPIGEHEIRFEGSSACGFEIAGGCTNLAARVRDWIMRFPRLLLVGVLLGGMAIHAQSGWTPLWNGTDLDGWTTWMRQPEPGSQVPGLKRDADGRYAEPIGSGRDPLKVFTVVRDVDGRPAIRISGEVFGELRTKGTFKNYHLKLQFKWGDKKWPPRDRPETPRDSGLLYHVPAMPGVGGRTWARSIELQIQEHDVGDLYAVGSAIAA